MNWRHFQAVIWLRWRIAVNQLRKGGAVNLVIQTLLTVAFIVGCTIAAVGLSIGLFLVGLFALRDASPAVVMLVWDGAVVAFIFFWMILLLAELNRSDPLSLDKFMHLPVSITGIFLINYLSSLANPILIVFVPAMFALSIGLAIAKGPALLLLLPLVGAFVLMVTAVTYQFQGWLAALMVNKRRRRTIVVLLTMGVILIFQLPNLINMAVFSRTPRVSASTARMAAEQNRLGQALSSGEITMAEYQKRSAEVNRERNAQTEEEDRQTLQQVESIAWIVNLCLPPGWLPLGAMTSAEGNAVALLALLGMAGLGAFSLWRSHQTTLKVYTGHFTSGQRRAVAVAVPAKQAKPPTAGMLEWRLPWLSEQASAVALGGLRSLIRTGSEDDADNANLFSDNLQRPVLDAIGPAAGGRSTSAGLRRHVNYHAHDDSTCRQSVRL